MNNRRNQINLEEEINRNMKGKFKLLGHIGLMLVLVSALVLTLAPVAQAATAVTDVWVQFTEADYNINHASTAVAAGFTVHFTPTTAMSRGVDTITVWVPDGSTDMGPAAFTLASANTTMTNYDVDRDGEASTYSATDCTSAATLSATGFRITVTTPVDLDAGSACSLKIAAAAAVKTSASTSSLPYKVKVYTSQDTTPVLSDSFDLDDDPPGAPVLTLSPTTAGSAGQYTFTMTLGELLAAGTGTVTVIFPYGTTVPSSISADNVSCQNNTGNWETCTVAPVVNQKARMVTITTPVELSAAASQRVRFATGANIVNPTTVKTSARTDCYVSTSAEEQFIAEADGYNVTAGTATKIGFNNDAYPGTSYSDSATMINMYSSRLFVEVQDTYGNLVDPDTEPTVSFTSSQGSGIFYTNAETDGTGAFTQVSSSATTDGLLTVYYRDSVAGTVTLTASATGYTSGTWAMTIAPGVSLYDSNDNLIKTYAATSTSAVAETGDGDPETQKYSVDYINDAITAAVAGDTVKLGDGIYELDAAISLSKKVTLTSQNGASYTTLRPTADTIRAINISTDGTTTNPLIIDGLTFDRLRTNYEFHAGVMNNGYDYVTVSNNTFNYIIPDQGTSAEGVVWTRSYAGSITSSTVSNNTFNNCVGFNAISGGRAASILFDLDSCGTNTMSGVTISGNTLTNCNDYGIQIRGNNVDPYRYVTAVITNNTITNGYSSLNLSDYIASATITGNTITGAYRYGIKVEGAHNTTAVAIKNNTITGCAGADSEGAIHIPDEDTASVITVQYNDISGNNGYAIYAAASPTGGHDCKYNYFGSATGPAYTALTAATVSKSNTGGAGDAITDKVCYYPWLHKSLADVVADNASYQASTMSLVSGWNTLSTPVKLISTADSIDELIPAHMTIGYYYDATGWHQITTGYVLNACDAVYVKMSIATDVLLKFDAGAWTMPSKALSAGWNLISLAYLSSSGKNADDAVVSVYQTAAGLPGYSQVISPSLNATQTNMFGVAGASWAYSSGAGYASPQDMFAGLGYWCYMQNAATLAGFEITPIAPDLD
jgi:hypothetical protein